MYEVILVHAMVVTDEDCLIKNKKSMLVNFVTMVQFFNEQGEPTTSYTSTGKVCETIGQRLQENYWMF